MKKEVSSKINEIHHPKKHQHEIQNKIPAHGEPLRRNINRLLKKKKQSLSSCPRLYPRNEKNPEAL
ncbi:hypothetical protein [Acetobacterium sp. KB-1]|uniref:hypothetical protein n=1 Tax=Acetobacterium sp. KB-1 TaxID=2184575 RepID=UPI001FA93FA9|nr:hypothetical protein [Acetobacterium sp. KB-1]